MKDSLKKLWNRTQLGFIMAKVAVLDKLNKARTKLNAIGVDDDEILVMGVAVVAITFIVIAL